MSDEGMNGTKVEPEPKSSVEAQQPQPAPSQLVSINIIANLTTGEVNVQSSMLGNRIMMYGLLEMAKEICFSNAARQGASRIVKPPPDLIRRIK